MKTYRKTATVQAFQWKGMNNLDSVQALERFVAPTRHRVEGFCVPRLSVLDGRGRWQEAQTGDYIVTSDGKDFYPVPAEVFETAYAEVR